MAGQYRHILFWPAMSIRKEEENPDHAVDNFWGRALDNDEASHSKNIQRPVCSCTTVHFPTLLTCGNYLEPTCRLVLSVVHFCVASGMGCLSGTVQSPSALSQESEVQFLYQSRSTQNQGYCQTFEVIVMAYISEMDTSVYDFKGFGFSVLTLAVLSWHV